MAEIFQHSRVNNIHDDAAAAVSADDTTAPAAGDKGTAAQTARDIAAAKLSADIRGLTPIQLQLAVDGMARLGTPMAVEKDDKTGEVLAITFHGQHDLTIEAGSG